MMFEQSTVIWVLLCAALVYFMQAGFALCEAGLTRAKNTGNILMKNMMDFCIGTPCFWIIGFSLMFHGTGAVIVVPDFLIRGAYTAENSVVPQTMPLWAYVIFQTVFCATAATIVSGSMAERTNFKAYCMYSAAISLLVYPICGHWSWGGGWLSTLGFHDFAGSAQVHNVGGIIACLGAALLGPRIGKYDKNGRARAIPGHNMTAVALGVFILWFCWFGFNGGSTVSMGDDTALYEASLAFMTTNLAAAVATCTAMIFTWVRYGKPDVSMTLNAALAGLVAITAGADCVSPVGAFFIGLVAGILVVFSVEFFDNVAKIDDPVGAVSVHFVNGVWGTLAVGLFSTGDDGVGLGLFYGGGFHQLGIQIIGILAIDIYVLIVMFVIFKLIDKWVGLRVPAQVEIDGLDIHEHGLASAYSGFAITDVTDLSVDVNDNTDLGEDSYEAASEAQKNAAVKVVRGPESPEVSGTAATASTGMYKVTIICRLNKFDELKKALNVLGVTGMTMTQVMGSGIQRGSTERYRGAIVDSTLLPKVKVEVIVSKVPVDAVIDTAKKTLYTGHIGDGKIFVYPVLRVVKVRTGEEDFAALQDVE
jgi:Amt family ammonium transporter